MPKRTQFILLFLILTIFLFPFIASDCDKILINENNGDIRGNWQLVYNSGTLHDVCPGESANFPSTTGGIATLKCPGRDSVLRDYTITNSILTYTQTGIEYTVVSVNSTELQLEGTGSSSGRYLYYSRVAADSPVHNPVSKNFENSSEVKPHE